MKEPKGRSAYVLEQIEQVNGGRSFLVNICGFLFVLLCLGVANLFTRDILHADLTWFMRVLMVALAVFFLLPSLILWVWTGKSSGRGST